MSPCDIGDPAPDFTLPTDGGGQITLSALRGAPVVVYFYPKDMTPGCTTQACDFRDALPDLATDGVRVVGISKDSPARHDRFKDKHQLTFPLAADEEGLVCDAYGVWKEKRLYGKTFMGIERSTFLIDAQGRIARIWRKVKVKGHVAEVVAAAAALK